MLKADDSKNSIVKSDKQLMEFVWRVGIDTFPIGRRILTHLQQTTFETIVAKGETPFHVFKSMLMIILLLKDISHILS